MHTALRNLLLFALPVAVACDPDPVLDEPSGHELEPAVGDLADREPTREPLASSALAAQIAKHPAFATLAQRANLRVDGYLDVIAGWSPSDRDMAAERLEACKHFEDQLCTDELQAMGVDLAIPAAEAQAAQQLSAAFGLAGMPFRERVVVFTEARQLWVASGGAAPGVASIPTSFGGQACDLECRQRVLGNLAASYGGAIATTISTPSPEDDDAQANVLMAGTSIIICGIIGPCWYWPADDDDPECLDDGDCDSDEYCWKGPLNLGDNECRPRRGVGEPCSRDGKCLSNCCKFNLWDLGSTCRAASECD